MRRLSGLAFAFLAAWTLFPAARLDAQGAAKEIQLTQALEPFVKNKQLAGAVVLVSDREKTLAQRAVGFADLERETLLSTDAVFWIASMSKPITAAALMILVDEGKVKLDDPVENYLPEFANVRLAGGEKAKSKMTVRQLLSHMSGMAFKSPQEAPTLDVLPLKDAVASYVKMPLVHEPGTKHLYSNMGINTAGRIIEVVSGMPYETFMDKRLFGPLGMADTTFWPNESQVKRLAVSYRPNAKKTALEPFPIAFLKYPLSDRATRYPMPGGGLFSTASDVASFCRMVLNNGTHGQARILSEKSVAEMTKRQTPATVPQNYGLGWSTGPDNFGHGGAYATNMTIEPKRGLVTVFLVQHAGFLGDAGKSQGEFRKAAQQNYSK